MTLDIRAEERAIAALYMRILNLLGCHQADLARHAGITTVQVNHWARGKRPIPEKYWPLIHRLVQQRFAVYAFVRQGDVLMECFDQVDALLEAIKVKYQAYVDHNLVLREIWMAEHGAHPHEKGD